MSPMPFHVRRSIWFYDEICRHTRYTKYAVIVLWFYGLGSSLRFRLAIIYLQVETDSYVVN